MNEHITRAEVLELCLKAHNSVGSEDSAKLTLQAVQAATDFLSKVMNPIRKDELPYLIYSLRTMAEQLSKMEPLAGFSADIMQRMFESSDLSEGVSPQIADAMRAMGWKE